MKFSNLQTWSFCNTGVNENQLLPLPEDDPKQRNPDISMAKSTLQWEPDTELEEGIRRTAE